MSRPDQAELVFLKLGGSLITDKTRPEAARTTVIRRLARELAETLRVRPSLRLVLGHGSGSYGHMVGERFGVRHGVINEEGWRGFALTAAAAQRIGQSRPGIAVLYVTGYASADLSQRGLEGVDSRRVLIKPFSPAEVARRVRQVLDLSQSSTSP